MCQTKWLILLKINTIFKMIENKFIIFFLKNDFI